MAEFGKIGELEAETFKSGGIQVDQGNYFKSFKDRLLYKNFPAGKPSMGKSWDIKEEYISQTENYLTKEGADQIPWLVVPKGAVLLSVSGTIGKAAIAGCDMTVNQAIQAMVFDEEQILPEYACFYLEFYRPWLIERANAVTVPNLTKEQLSGIPVVFPCLEEQQVIVDQLKRARRLMQRSRRSEDTLNRILENAFGKIARSALKEGKISRDEEFLSPVLRPIWVSLKTRVLPAEHETDMFVPVLSQTEQVSFIKIVERTKEIRKRLHKIQQLEIRYFKSMLSLAFTAGLTEGFRKQEDLSDPEPALFRESYGIGNVRSQPANRRHYRLAEPYSTGIAVSFYHAV